MLEELDDFIKPTLLYELIIIIGFSKKMFTNFFEQVGPHSLLPSLEKLWKTLPSPLVLQDLPVGTVLVECHLNKIKL